MVEVAVESADAFELVGGHDGSVDGVTRGNRWVFVDELFGIVHDGTGDRQDLGEKAARQGVDLLSLGPTAQRPITVNDLLQQLRIDGGLEFAIGDSF